MLRPIIVHSIYEEITFSLDHFLKNKKEVLKSAEGKTLVITDNGKPILYGVNTPTWKRLRKRDYIIEQMHEQKMQRMEQEWEEKQKQKKKNQDVLIKYNYPNYNRCNHTQ